MKKSLFIAFERNLSSLPPLLTQIELLNEIYDTTVSVAKVESEFVERYPNVMFISYYNWIEPKKKLDRVINRINRSYSFPRFVKRYLKNNRPNLFWIGSAEAAFLLKPIEKYLANIPYNLNIYELYDRKPIMLRRIKKIAQNAEKIIVPEYNRANILRLWLGLKETPIVIPNKPIFHPRKRNLPIPPDLQSKMAGKKIILYQGHITSDRNIDILCETIQELPDFQLVLLDEEGRYYHVEKGHGKRYVACNRPSDRSEDFDEAVALLRRQADERVEKRLREEKCEYERKRIISRSVEAVPFQIGVKWGLRTAERILIPPVYRRILHPVGGYCAYQDSSCQWGVLAVDGRIIIRARYMEVEIDRDGTARLTLVPGKMETVKLTD